MADIFKAKLLLVLSILDYSYVSEKVVAIKVPLGKLECYATTRSNFYILSHSGYILSSVCPSNLITAKVAPN